MAGTGLTDLFTFPAWPRAGLPELYFVRQLKPLPAVSDLLTVNLSHAGNFAQGQTGAMYTVTVSNAPSGGATVGAVTVAESVPAGLELVSMTGAGWICSNNTCTRTDTLNPGAAFPPITVTVNVDLDVPAQVTNQVSLTGGAAPAASASDITTILPYDARFHHFGKHWVRSDGHHSEHVDRNQGRKPRSRQHAIWRRHLEQRSRICPRLHADAIERRQRDGQSEAGLRLLFL
jgi:uncharacterized repeat protein (TIGR01451 family)